MRPDCETAYSLQLLNKFHMPSRDVLPAFRGARAPFDFAALRLTCQRRFAEIIRVEVPSPGDRAEREYRGV